MKRSGILNPGLLSLLSQMGHTDYLTIADRGFPIPANQSRVDLALVDGIPTVLDVLLAIESEFIIDRMIVTDEMMQISRYRYECLRKRFPNLRFDAVPHLALKHLCADGKGVVRTGDTCPYGNLIIVSG